MNKLLLPRIRLAAKPKGLVIKTPKAALDRWDKNISLAAKKEETGADIDILGEIGDPMWGGVNAEVVKKQLASAGKGPIKVTLNSPGGDAFEGVAIYNLLREHPGKVTVNVLGLAASAASVIAMAGDRIEIGEAAFLMIHSAWGVVMGNRNDMREFAALLDQLDNSVAELYARRSGLSVDEIIKMMEKETWMSGKEAVKQGFADYAVADTKKKESKASSHKTYSVQSSQVPLALLASSGDQQRSVVRLSAVTPPVVTGINPTNLNEGNGMTLAEQIAAFEAKYKASLDRKSTIMSAAAEQMRTLDEKETAEFDALDKECATVQEHIARLKAHQTQMVSQSTAIVPAEGQAQQNTTQVRGAVALPGPGTGMPQNSNIVSVTANVEKGIAFTRYVKALCMARGSLTGALAIAQNNKNWNETTPQVAKVLMAAVAGGDTTTSGWASELVYNQNLAAEFIEYLRPQTILGKLTGLTRVPFNVRMSGQDSGSSAYWVGQGKPVPVSKLNTLEVTLGIAKAAGLVVLTDELVRSSDPSAELLVRNDLAASIAAFLDIQFIAPDYAAVANVSPASITNGVVPTAATGTSSTELRTDVKTLFGTWIAANLRPTGGAWVMTETQALSISLMLNSLGQPLFPDMTMSGGTFFGLPVVTSQAAKMVGSPVAGEGNLIVLINQPEILLADDGAVTIDASREASLEMLDNPTNATTASVTATSMVSMFQTNSVAIKAVRFINWKKRRSTAVAYIKDANYTT